MTCDGEDLMVVQILILYSSMFRSLGMWGIWKVGMFGEESGI